MFRRLVIVGAGGLGTAATWGIVAGWSSNTRLEIHLYDPECLERSNLHRQVMYRSENLGEKKASLLATRLTTEFQNSHVDIVPHLEAVSETNIAAVCHGADFVIEASDSIVAKFLVNDHCTKEGLPFCYAGAIGSHGLLWFRDPRQTNSACLRCLFGSYSTEELAAQSLTCSEAGIYGPVAGFIGFLQANVCLRFFSGARLSQFQGYRFSAQAWRAAEFFCEPAIDCPLGCGHSLPESQAHHEAHKPL